LQTIAANGTSSIANGLNAVNGTKTASAGWNGSKSPNGLGSGKKGNPAS